MVEKEIKTIIDDEETDGPASYTKLKSEEWEVSVYRSCEGGGTGREFFSNLKLEGNEAWNKWYDPSYGETWILAKFKTPTSIKMIGLKSANDCPERDPYKVDILVEYENNENFILVETLDELDFDERHQLQDFALNIEGKITALKVLIKINKAVKNGKYGSGTQLNELVLYK